MAEPFSEILDASPSGIAVLIAPELRFVFTNRAYRSATLEREEDPVGRRLREVLEGKDLDRIAPVLENVLATGQAANVGREVRTGADGRTHTYSYHARRILWTGTAAVLVVLWDTTELEQARDLADRSLREARALQRITEPYTGDRGVQGLLESLVDRVREVMAAHASTIFLLDPDHGDLVLRVSSGLSRQDEGLRLGIGDNLVGRVAQSGQSMWLRDAQENPAVWTSYVRSRAIRGILACPMRWGGRLTGVVHVDFVVPHEFSAAEVYLLAVMAERAANALHVEVLLAENLRERERLRTLIATAPIGIVSYDARGRLREVNDAAETIAGRPVERGLSAEHAASHYSMYHPTGEHLADEEHPAVCALRGLPCVRKELVFHHPTGREVVVEASSAPVRDRADHVVGAVMVLDDVTVKREQEQLRTEFVTAAAHELKTPLTVVNACLEVLSHRVQAHDKKVLDMMARACARMDQRADELLEAVQLKRAPAPVRSEPVDLRDLVLDVADRTRRDHPQHLVRADCPQSLFVRCDSSIMRQALLHLMENAIQRSDAGGTIDIRGWREGADAHLSVTDEGGPVPPERQKHVFEPFYRPALPGSTDYRSTVGLALYLVKLAAEVCGGEACLETHQGHGATVHLRIPLAKG